MKIGTFAYATSRGLGHLVKSFYDHGVVTDVLVVRHPSIPMNEDWYPDAPIVNVRAWDSNMAKDFCLSVDKMFFFETAFDWDIFNFCRAHGIPTAIMPMYECTQKRRPGEPDLWVCPSLLDVEYFKQYRHKFLPIPSNIRWTERKHAFRYVHNGGYLGLRGREGTTTLIDAMELVKSPIKLLIRVQENVTAEYQRKAAANPKIEYITGTVPMPDLHTIYECGDVYVAPQKFNGCSLPLQEAYGNGMLVLTTKRFPMTSWLPIYPMFSPESVRTVNVGSSYLDIEECIIDPQAIADSIDHWFGQDISSYSEMGRRWSEANSWEVLKPQYMEVLENL